MGQYVDLRLENALRQPLHGANVLLQGPKLFIVGILQDVSKDLGYSSPDKLL